MLSVIVLVSVIGQAQFNLVLPVSIAEVSEIELGDIYNTKNNICTLTTISRTGSACATSDFSLGEIQLLGNEEQSVLIKVSGSNSSQVEFTPLLPNGTQQQLFSLATNASIYIGGEIKVISDGNLGMDSISYTIEVNYQ
ncbi:Conserved hypothetical protein [Shewanella piezotolerans WP3]|uniref:DUF4402 domain-containing protein n=1 Tax=Shewanella piezotolerans (strain WP3 / JCM 13877) TaxID=225849 RepID=B8CNY7_SHEPW|nr:hypothetical protein [Shewanella piezotolerans]ACJ29106.1 Conserved hypothetical protein [Shewanella piezotolerans WP3]